MTEEENGARPGTDVIQQRTGTDAAQQSDQERSALDDAAAKVEQLIKAFSQSASKITGRIISLVGLALVLATFMLGIVHLLGTGDFVASIVSGAALSIAGIAMITTDNARSQRAVAQLLSTSGTDAFKREIEKLWPPAS
jgi:H2-forming N5,N10-methylenetetrahydromethanopterin dehydrogenase-like enzyme